MVGPERHSLTGAELVQKRKDAKEKITPVKETKASDDRIKFWISNTKAKMIVIKSNKLKGGVDTRCHGGQNIILNQMTNHYAALVNIKPTYNTR